MKCYIVTSSILVASELKKDGLVTTVGSDLPASKIIHVQSPDTLAAWRTKLVAVLEEANKLELKSLALPLLSIGRIFV